MAKKKATKKPAKRKFRYVNRLDGKDKIDIYRVQFEYLGDPVAVDNDVAELLARRDKYFVEV